MSPDRESSARARCAQVESACDGTKGISALDCAMGATYAPTIVGYPVPSHIAYGPDARCVRDPNQGTWTYLTWVHRAPSRTTEQAAYMRTVSLSVALVVLMTILWARARQARK